MELEKHFIVQVSLPLWAPHWSFGWKWLLWTSIVAILTVLVSVIVTLMDAYVGKEVLPSLGFMVLALSNCPKLTRLWWISLPPKSLQLLQVLELKGNDDDDNGDDDDDDDDDDDLMMMVMMMVMMMTDWLVLFLQPIRHYRGLDTLVLWKSVRQQPKKTFTMSREILRQCFELKTSISYLK